MRGANNGDFYIDVCLNDPALDISDMSVFLRSIWMCKHSIYTDCVFNIVQSKLHCFHAISVFYELILD